MMKTWMLLGSAALVACAVAQQDVTRKTTETKVGLGRHGVEVTRRKVTTIDERSDRRMRGARPTAIKVVVDGTMVDFPDQGPISRNDRVLVPLRGVFQQMGARVDWDRESNTVTAVRGHRQVVLPLSSTRANVDGRPMRLDQPAMVMRGRALVPLRFLSEALGATVDWREADLTVTVKS